MSGTGIRRRGIGHEVSTTRAWRQRLASALCGMLLGVIIPTLALGQATLLPDAKQQYLDAAGNPVAGGNVTYYVPSTSTKKNVWLDAAKATLSTNPVILDAAGRPQPTGQTFGDGIYRQKVVDSDGNTVWDAITASTGGGSTPTTPTVGDGLTVGSILPWGGLTAPPNYLLAYGQAITRTSYPLFFTTVTIATNVICTSGLNVLSGIFDTQNIRLGAPVEASCVPPGTTVTAVATNSVTVSANAAVSTAVVATFFPFGNGNGSTTFNVPDLRGRVLAGRNNMGGTAGAFLTAPYFFTSPNALGAAGGGESHQLTLAEIPSGIVSSNRGAISLNVTTTDATIPNAPGGLTSSNATGGVNNQFSGTASTVSARVSTGSIPIISVAVTSDNTGNTAHSIIQPSFTMNYVIKVLPDVSTVVASGVASIGGMTGVLLCGEGIVCGSNTISLSTVLPVLSVGVTPILFGTNKGLLYDNAGTLGNLSTVTNGALVTNGSGDPSISTAITLRNQSGSGAYQALDNVGATKNLLLLGDNATAVNSTRLRSGGGAVTLEKSDASAIASFLENGQVGIGTTAPITGALLDIQQGSINNTVINPTMTVPVLGFEPGVNYVGASSMVTYNSSAISTGNAILGQVINQKASVASGVQGSLRDDVGYENYGVIGILSVNHNGGTGGGGPGGFFIRNTTGATFPGTNFIPNPNLYTGTVGTVIGNEATVSGGPANASIGLYVFGLCAPNAPVSVFCPQGPVNDNSFVLGANIVNARDEMLRFGSNAGNGYLAPSVITAYANDNSLVYKLNSTAQITSKNSAAPATPSSGYTTYWTDSTTGRLSDKASDGSVGSLISLSQPIVDTASGGGPNAAFVASAVNPAHAWRATAQPVDQKFWDIIVIGGGLQFRTVNDANNVAVSWMTVDRGFGTAVSGVNIPLLTRGVKSYGASGSAQGTNGTITTGSSTLNLSSAIDFRNGDGIIVNHAGVAATAGAPTITSVAPVNSTGSTTYAYKLTSRDNAGGLSAATGATTITNGDATLGTYQAGMLGVTMNRITWTMGSGSPQCTGVYRSKSGGAYDFLGCFKGTTINDAGLPAVSLFGFPATPPITSLPQWLATTIVSGAGTTALTLAATATNGVIGEAVSHDDTAAIVAAAAANSALYFPAGTYTVRGLQFPSTVRSINGDGPVSSTISSLAETSDGLGGGVSASMGGGAITVADIRIEAALSMSFDGLVVSNAATPRIHDSAFVGKNALHIVSSSYPIIHGNRIPSWWNIAIWSDTNTNERILGNTISPITGQAGTVALTNWSAGSAYPFEVGILATNTTSTAGTRLIAANTVVMNGGVWGVAAGGGATSVEANAIFSSGRECMVGGSPAVSIGSNATFRGNDCTWAPAGNGNLSGHDFGFSSADDGVNPITNLVITNNKFTNPGYSGVAIFGSGVVGAPYTDTVISDNQIYGSNQLPINNCGIYLVGRNVAGATVANNATKSVTANMTYSVCEDDNGNGAPDYTIVSLPIGSPGSSSYVNLLGSHSQSILLPSHTGQLATLAGTESLSNKTLPSPIIATPQIQFGTGGSSSIVAGSTNTAAQNAFVVRNGGVVTSSTVFLSTELSAVPNTNLQMGMLGSATPTAVLESGPGATGGLQISADAGSLRLVTPTITGSFTATGLVKNADLVNPATTVNSQTCSLGSTCTVTATASAALTFGTHLTSGGPSYNGSTGVTITSDATNANTASTIVARDGSGNFSAGTITASLTGHASLDCALTGCTMSGAIAMGGNNITGGGTGTFTTLTGTGGSHTGLTGLGIRSTGAAFDLTLASSEIFTAGRTLTVTLNDVARTLNMGGNITTAGATSLPAIAQGDLWYGSATGVLSALAKSTTATRYLANTGTSNNPAWDQINLANGVTGTLPAANGGLGDTGTAWPTYSVTVGCGGAGSAGTSSAVGRQKTLPVGGKTIAVQIDIASSGVVTCASGYTVTLPSVPQSTAIFSGFNKSTTTTISAYVSTAGVNGVSVNTTAVTGQFVSLTGVYESQ